MNKRSIINNLLQKHNDFLNSIQDEEIKNLIKNNTIITGGCITSMLLNEKVNDYDYYFTNKLIALKVLKYYAKQFGVVKSQIGSIYVTQDNQIVKEDEDWDRIRIKLSGMGTNKILENTEEYGEENPIPSILEQADEINASNTQESENKENKYEPVYISDNAITLTNQVQLIIRFFGLPEEIHKNFDYIHCTNYFVPNKKELYLEKLALESTLTKELIYTGSLYPLCSIIRMRKFLSRGWHINAGQILKMCMQISELNLNDISVLNEQLIGVDVTYFIQLIEELKIKQEENKESLSVPFVASLIDRIFG